jgi:hypothetical protein
MSRQHVSSRETHHEKTEEFFKYDKYDKDELLLLRLLLLASIVDAVEGMIQEIVDLDDSLLLCDFEGMIQEMAFLAHVCALLTLRDTSHTTYTPEREREGGRERERPAHIKQGSGRRTRRRGGLVMENASPLS